jgi:hypothetical protein
VSTRSLECLLVDVFDVWLLYLKRFLFDPIDRRTVREVVSMVDPFESYCACAYAFGSQIMLIRATLRQYANTLFFRTFWQFPPSQTLRSCVRLCTDAAKPMADCSMN